MAENEYIRKPYIGFTFNGRAAEEFSLVRVSSSDRYNISLLPEIENTINENSLIGKSVFKKEYGNLKIDIPIAFDSMNQKQFDQLSIWLDEIGQLVLDEKPNEVYMVKLASSPKLTFLCFEENGERIYKGEGTLNFISYDNDASQDYGNSIMQSFQGGLSAIINANWNNGS